MKKYLFILILFLIPSVGADVLVDDDFTDGDYTNNPTWTVWGGTPQVTDQKLYFNSVDWDIYTTLNNDGSSGWYSAEFDGIINGTANNDGVWVCFFNYPNYDGSICADVIYHTDNGKTDLNLFSDYETTGLEEISDSINFSNIHNYKLVFDNSTRTAQFYIDDSSQLSLIIPTNVTLNFSYFEINGGNNNNGYIDNIYVENSTIAPTPTPTTTPTSLNYTAPTAFEECECLWNDLYIWILGTIVMFALCVFDRR